MNLIDILLEIHESTSISEDEKDLLIEFAYNKYIDDFMDDAQSSLYESIMQEAEEDTDPYETGVAHTSKARQHSRNLNPPKSTNFGEREKEDKKNVGALPNGKFKRKKDGSYVDPEKAKKAKLKYQAADDSYTSSGGVKHKRNKAYGADEFDTKVTPSDKKMIEYMRKQAKNGDPESIKKYKQVYKMFCTKYGIKPDSSIHMRMYGDSKNPTSKMQVTEVESGKEMTGKDTGAKDKKSLNPFKKAQSHSIPKGYMLIHTTTKDKLKELKPSTNVNSAHTDAEQFHDKGRVYFYLLSEKDVKERIKKAKGGGLSGYGNHIYTPAGAVSSFFVDNERGTEKQTFRDVGVKGFAASRSSAVFVKTDNPIKVKQLC